MFIENDTMMKLNALNVQNAHGHYDISTCMFKVGGASISHPLAIILRNCSNHGKLPKVWKKTNFTPIFKKGDKFLVKHCRPVSVKYLW